MSLSECLTQIAVFVEDMILHIALLLGAMGTIRTLELWFFATFVFLMSPETEPPSISLAASTAGEVAL